MLLDSPGWVLPVLLTALATDALLGEPPWLYRRLPHPVVAIGRVVGRLERHLLVATAGEARKRAAGVLLLVLVAGGSFLLGTAIQAALRPLPLGWLAEGLLLGTLLAQRSLAQHVAAVAQGLRQGLPAGRKAVAMIVGRDPERLDAAGVGRAAIESLAENLSDGVMAPLFWAAVAGLPGILAYKAINTLDSMVGHRNERYRAFGWASARCDDLVNLVPARLTGVLLCLAGALLRQRPLQASLGAMRRDAPRHRSPNAGWPEAAMAAVLGLRLNGPRSYDGVVVADAWMGDGRSEVGPADIDQALRLAWTAWWLATGAIGAALVAVLSL
jgi:adenosylcobinamide-phosphate synthase